MAKDLWASSRLVYRGCDGEADDEFLATILEDPDAFLNASITIPLPRNKKETTSFREHMTSDKVLLFAIICLPPTQNQDQPVNSVSSEAKGHDDQKANKPTPIGFIALSALSREFAHHRKSAIGLQILRPYQGQGYGTEAIEWALRWGFRRANLHRIGIGCGAWNMGAFRLYERIGFVKEARMRDFFWHDGEYHDVIELAMLEDEWRARYGMEK